jgi:uncharacterized protein YndB with AHSA1/START domain
MSQVEPIRRSVSVRIDPQRAFELFTTGIATWWPVDRFSRAADLEEEGLKVESLEFHGYVGGPILERLSDGRVLPWAEILEWDPPHRFVMGWKPHSRPQPATEVEVRFTPEGSGTLVELEHRGWERLTEDYRERYATYGKGWVGTLSRFAEAADREVA